MRSTNGSPGSRSSMMMLKRSPCRSALTGLLACLVSLTMAAGVASSAPRTINASYGGYMNGMAIGAITEHFEVEGGTYRIVSDTKPMGLAVFVQRNPLKFISTGQVTREGLHPVHFEARRNAGDPPQITADFDWANGQLQLRHNGKVESVPLTPGAQDRLSIMYQFMFMKLEKAHALEFSMTNGRKLDHYRYQITAGVELDTPLGRLRTLHLVKQREPADTVTEVWLSPQHQYFPVKLLIIEKDAVRYEQLIQSLELRD